MIINKLLPSLLLSILAGLTSYKFQLSFSSNSLASYYNALLVLSGMIFTIMGIWIAFVYPNAIKRLQDTEKIITADFSETMEDTRRLESIVTSILLSGFVSVSIVSIYFAKIIISSIPADSINFNILTPILAGVTVFISILQIQAVASVAIANFLFIEDLHSKREKIESDCDV